jgi:hypothetical protein
MNHLKSFYDQAFAKMPNVFTSNQFAIAVRKYFPASLIPKNNQEYLNTVCDRIGNPNKNRLWRKKVVAHTETLPLTTEQYTNDCITHLKSLGYKVMKPIVEFTEC